MVGFGSFPPEKNIPDPDPISESFKGVPTSSRAWLSVAGIGAKIDSCRKVTAVGKARTRTAHTGDALNKLGNRQTNKQINRHQDGQLHK